MRDSIVRITIAGLIGAAIVNGLSLLYRLMGIRMTMPWAIASDIFLTRNLAGTPIGTALGLVATVGLSVGTALVIMLLLRWTGTDYAWLKGLIGANAFGFITLGLFMPLLGIWPAVQREPITNVAALLTFSALGLILGRLFEYWSRESVK